MSSIWNVKVGQKSIGATCTSYIHVPSTHRNQSWCVTMHLVFFGPRVLGLTGTQAPLDCKQSLSTSALPPSLPFVIVSKDISAKAGPDNHSLFDLLSLPPFCQYQSPKIHALLSCLWLTTEPPTDVGTRWYFCMPSQNFAAAALTIDYTARIKVGGASAPAA